MIFFIQIIVWITSILRWHYTTNKYFQFLDHNYVKLVFITLIYYCFRSFSFKNDIYIYFYICSLISVDYFIFYQYIYLIKKIIKM